jgi:hypothetical protein
MKARNSFFAVAVVGVASVLGACGTTQKAEVTPASFNTPPVWLDRVELVSWMPKAPEGEPVLADYENEPSRFFFRGVPLAPSDMEEDVAVEDGGLPEGINSSQNFSGPGGG